MNELDARFPDIASRPTDLSLSNIDQFRASVGTLRGETVVKALLWLRGKTPFPYPTSIHLDLTLRCTARCVHCEQWTWPAHSELTTDQLEKLICTFESWGVRTITFGGGNPLMHKHVVHALQLARQAGMRVGIVSESADLPDKLADAICRYASWIRFSLDGPDSNTHDAIRNTPGLFDRVIGNIKKLQDRKTQLKIGLNCVIQKANLNSLSQMIALANRMRVEALLFKAPHGEDPDGLFLPCVEDWRKVVKWIESVTEERNAVAGTNLTEFRRLVDVVFREDDVVKGTPVKKFYVEEQIRCFTPLLFLTCDSEGNMYPCDYLQADTRVWRGKYGDMRNRFGLGNVLVDDRSVLDYLAGMLKRELHGLPASGYTECGCCTRFCQLNAALTQIDDKLQARNATGEEIKEYIAQIKPAGPEMAFL